MTKTETRTDNGLPRRHPELWERLNYRPRRAVPNGRYHNARDGTSWRPQDIDRAIHTPIMAMRYAEEPELHDVVLTYGDESEPAITIRVATTEDLTAVSRDGKSSHRETGPEAWAEIAGAAAHILQVEGYPVPITLIEATGWSNADQRIRLLQAQIKILQRAAHYE